MNYFKWLILKMCALFVFVAVDETVAHPALQATLWREKQRIINYREGDDRERERRDQLEADLYLTRYIWVDGHSNLLLEVEKASLTHLTPCWCRAALRALKRSANEAPCSSRKWCSWTWSSPNSIILTTTATTTTAKRTQIIQMYS